MSTGEQKKPDRLFDENERDGQEPLEDVGPGECEVEQEKCELAVGAKDGAPGECQFEIHDELYDALPIEKIPIVMDEVDGLPRPADLNDNVPVAHPFTIDTICCLEDKRKYVEIFSEEFIPICRTENCREFTTSFVTRSKFVGNGSVKNRLEFDPGRVVVLFDQEFVRLTNDEASIESALMAGSSSWDWSIYVPVRPVRERCKYYKRQVFAHDGIKPGEYGHNLVFRNCTKRLSVGGAFMSLRDEAVYACDYRDPPDPVTVKKYLDDPDDKKLNERPDLTRLPLFGMDGDEEITEEKK